MWESGKGVISYYKKLEKALSVFAQGFDVSCLTVLQDRKGCSSISIGNAD